MTTERDKLNELSVFFPCYNEEKNIVPLIHSALAELPKVATKYEILIINDGSKDSTSALAHAMAASYPCVRVIDQANKGYGGAVKAGFKNSKYEWVFFTDADLQFDLGELENFIPKAKQDTIAIGYRMNRADNIVRTFYAKLLKIWNKIFLGFPLFIKDIDCAYKLIPKVVLESVGELSSDGAMITTEFLLKVYRLGFNFEQIGVSHYKRKFGKSTGGNPKVILKAIKETFKLKSLLNSPATVEVYSPQSVGSSELLARSKA